MKGNIISFIVSFLCLVIPIWVFLHEDTNMLVRHFVIVVTSIILFLITYQPWKNLNAPQNTKYFKNFRSNFMIHLVIIVIIRYDNSCYHNTKHGVNFSIITKTRSLAFQLVFFWTKYSFVKSQETEFHITFLISIKPNIRYEMKIFYQATVSSSNYFTPLSTLQ